MPVIWGQNRQLLKFPPGSAVQGAALKQSSYGKSWGAYWCCSAWVEGPSWLHLQKGRKKIPQIRNFLTQRLRALTWWCREDEAAPVGGRAQASHHAVGTERGMEKGFCDPQDESAPVINQQGGIWEAGAVGTAGDAPMEKVCNTQLQHSHSYRGSPGVSAPAIPSWSQAGKGAKWTLPQTPATVPPSEKRDPLWDLSPCPR